MSDVAHGKKIIIESYFDGELTKTQGEFEVNIFSTKETILKDIIEALGVVTQGETNRLELSIMIDKQGRYRIIKHWREI